MYDVRITSDIYTSKQEHLGGKTERFSSYRPNVGISIVIFNIMFYGMVLLSD
jgi:hypothetical protein